MQGFIPVPQLRSFLLYSFLGVSITLAAPPNILFILADDQGWTGLSAPMQEGNKESRSDYYETPELEKFAKGGMVFSDAYAPHPMCGPTRHSIQWGRSPVTMGIFGRSRDLAGAPSEGLANQLKSVEPSYRAAHFGKWHIGLHPEELGYDTSDGLTENVEGNTDDPQDPKQIFSLTERASAFMQQCVDNGNPFYCQVSHWAIHSRQQSLPETMQRVSDRQIGERHSNALFAGCTEDLDSSVGLLLNKLDALGVRENTWIFYMSDNGAPGRGIGMNAPLRGAKGDVWEGGVRVPMIVQGPGVTPSTYCKQPVIGYDLLPTFLNLAKPGTERPAWAEGGDLSDLFKNGDQGSVARGSASFVFHQARPLAGLIKEAASSIRSDQYKLEQLWKSDKFYLFDVEKDPGETQDLKTSHPEIAKRLQAELHARLTQRLGEAHLEMLSTVEAGTPRQSRGRPKN